ncbi:MAG: hypothetical protein J0M18_00480 [Ignavibacteria bacterium]|jgi:hypothetical protein|nr:hypothetical protein [Ignavibacteria bacterium]
MNWKKIVLKRDYRLRNNLKKLFARVFRSIDRKTSSFSSVERISDIYLPTGKIILDSDYADYYSILYYEHMPIGKFPVYKYDHAEKFALIKFRNNTDVVKWATPIQSYLTTSGIKTKAYLKKKIVKTFSPNKLRIYDLERYYMELARFLLTKDPRLIAPDLPIVSRINHKLPFKDINLTHQQITLQFVDVSGRYFPFLGINEDNEIVCLVFYVLQKK